MTTHATPRPWTLVEVGESYTGKVYEVHGANGHIIIDCIHEADGKLLVHCVNAAMEGSKSLADKKEPQS